MSNPTGINQYTKGGGARQQSKLKSREAKMTTAQFLKDRAKTDPYRYSEISKVLKSRGMMK